MELAGKLLQKTTRGERNNVEVNLNQDERPCIECPREILARRIARHTMLIERTFLLVINEDWYGKGRTSKRPNPARTAVLPSWNGSHAKPTRGSKLCNVGFENKGDPNGCAGSVGVCRLAQTL